MSDRAERLARELRRELSELVARSVKDPRVQAAALVTVTHVRLSPDLSVADVLVSVVGGDAEGVVRALGRAAGFLRGELLRRLRTKKAPSLRFHVDTTSDRAEKIDVLLKQIHDEAAPTPAADGRSDEPAPAPAADGRSDEAAPAPAADGRSDEAAPAPAADSDEDSRGS